MLLLRERDFGIQEECDLFLIRLVRLTSFSLLVNGPLAFYGLSLKLLAYR